MGEKNIAELTAFSIDKLQKFLQGLELTETQLLIGEQILKEIKARIQFLLDVGLDYLTLARATGTLSGGEAQRIRLATQIGFPDLLVWPIFWMNRVSDCISGTTTSYLPH